MGQDAVELGLVDGLEGLDEVVRRAAAKVGIDRDYRVLTFSPARPGLMERGLRYLGLWGGRLLGLGPQSEDVAIEAR
jgi:ClpP class serine protease